MVSTRDIRELLLAIYNKQTKKDCLLNVVESTFITHKGYPLTKYSIEFYHRSKDENMHNINIVDAREFFRNKEALYQYLGDYYKALVGDS